MTDSRDKMDSKTDINTDKVNHLLGRLGKAYAEVSERKPNLSSINPESKARLLAEELEKLREKHREYVLKSEKRIEQLNHRIDALNKSHAMKIGDDLASQLNALEEMYHELKESGDYTGKELKQIKERITAARKKLSKDSVEVEHSEPEPASKEEPVAGEEPGPVKPQELNEMEQFSHKMLEPDAKPVMPEMSGDEPPELPKLDPPGPLPSLEMPSVEQSGIPPLKDEEMFINSSGAQKEKKKGLFSFLKK